MGATPGANKEHKAHLQQCRAIHCGYCRYNRGENAKHTDRHNRAKRDAEVERRNARRERGRG